MLDKYVLAIDAGSSGGRAHVVDLRGKVVGMAGRDWSYRVPAGAGPLAREFDPEEFWDLICRLIQEAVGKADIDAGSIIGVSAASQREGLVFLDKSGKELYAGPNTDIRAVIEGFTIDGEHGKEVYAITGHTPSLLFAPAKLKWFAANRPDIYERIETVLSIGSWILYRMSGHRTGEPSCDSDSGLLDVGSVCWSNSLTEMLRLPEGLCPNLALAGTALGPVSAAAARQTGLTGAALVVVGGADTQCGLLGMGVEEEGEVGIVAGWSGSLQMVTSKPVIDPEGKIWTGCHVLPGKWVTESNAQQSGGAYSWLRGLIFGLANPAEVDYAEMDRMARGAPPGAGGVIAFIGPMLMDMTRMRPSLGGFIFPVTPGITCTRENLVRAALENIAFAFTANCRQLERVTGLGIREVRIGGGLARSSCLTQILADVLQMPVISFNAGVTSVGAAMCAAVGCGVFPDLVSASEFMRPQSRVVEPAGQNADEYAALYQKWLATADWLDRLGIESG